MQWDCCDGFFYGSLAYRKYFLHFGCAGRIILRIVRGAVCGALVADYRP
jgi:hypothetical protein